MSQKWICESANVGAVLIFYIIGEKTLGGILKITKKPFKESKRIFEGGTYPFWMEVTVVHLPDTPIPFSAELRDKLDLIKNGYGAAHYIRLWFLFLRKILKFF